MALLLLALVQVGQEQLSLIHQPWSTGSWSLVAGQLVPLPGQLVSLSPFAGSLISSMFACHDCRFQAKIQLKLNNFSSSKCWFKHHYKDSSHEPYTNEVLHILSTANERSWTESQCRVNIFSLQMLIMDGIFSASLAVD